MKLVNVRRIRLRRPMHTPSAQPSEAASEASKGAADLASIGRF